MEHGFDHVERQGDAYVLVCTCGWRSHPSPSAARIGDEWDRHRGVPAAS